MMRSKAMALVSTLALLAGCKGTGALEETRPVTVPLGTYETVRLVVTPENEDQAQAALLVEAKLSARLKHAGVFTQVVSPSVEGLGEPTLELRAQILDLSRVSSTGRAFAGGLAGRGAIELDVSFIDLATGEAIGSLLASGKSSGGSVFSGTTAQAIEQAVDRIVAYVVAHR